jgi:hypothetical protein
MTCGRRTPGLGEWRALQGRIVDDAEGEDERGGLEAGYGRCGTTSDIG